MDNKNKNGGMGGLIAIIILFSLLLSMCSDSGSSRSSSRKWSDLSETEKNNARWAYYAKQEIDKRK